MSSDNLQCSLGSKNCKATISEAKMGKYAHCQNWVLINEPKKLIFKHIMYSELPRKKKT